MEESNMEQMRAAINKDKHQEVKRLAKAEGRTLDAMYDIIIELGIEAYYKEKGE